MEWEVGEESVECECERWRDIEGSEWDGESGAESESDTDAEVEVES